MANLNTLSSRAFSVIVAVLILCTLTESIGRTFSDTGLTPRDYHRPNVTGICKSMDIRNTLKSFDKLKGCRVVEGFVQILLFDNVNESAFDEISFPELTEITDFLLLYRVNGLRSVGKLFPNLTIIRGQDKVFEYSLVIYEMSSLQEVGLHSLRVIRSGLVRIDKNPSLCFVNSIDWDLIAEEKGDHFIKNIKAENECPLCPGDDDTGDKVCPISKNKLNIGRHLCWNRQHCQKVCPLECKYSCNNEGKCCDSKCLGCHEGNSSDCKLCWNVTVDSNICAVKCPPNRYKFLDRRCVTSKQCMSIERPLKLQSRVQQEYPYKIFNESCVLECPSDYMESIVNGLHTCIPCEGRCKKECQGAVIDSIISAQQFRGCTHINGSLEIQIRGGKNLVNELEESLSMVEEIGGYIKVVRSFPLVSLSFFKKLRVIHGNVLESQKYVFVVLDNQNLQDIWNWENRSLTINNKKGRLFFHFNPKLCLDKIRTLKEKANLSEFTDLEVATNSNGDKIACNVKDLVVNVTVKTPYLIVLKWAPFPMRDHRKLLGYVVYSIEAPYKNITMYDGRDACGGDGWRVDDVPITSEQTEDLTYLLTQLKPYTQYAFYVKTYTIASEESGAQSQIYYVRTKPHLPSPPTECKIRAEGSDSFSIQWNPPHTPNGNVTYYIITGIREVENQTEVLNQRKYCSIPSKEKYFTRIEPKALPKQNDTCLCDNVPKPISTKIKNETDVSNQIDFEDALHNHVYIKRDKFINNRRKRDMNGEEFPKSKEDTKEIAYESHIINKTDEAGRYISFAFRVEGKLELFISNLKHYTDYNIHIQACREQEKDNDNTYCSENLRKRERTGKKETADFVTGITYNVSIDSVTITWDSSLEPNGYIIAYDIKYNRLDIDNSQAITKCITEVDFLNQNKKCFLNKLSPGNYSLEIAARSQAGYGNYSKCIYFYIEESTTTPVIVIILSVVCICIIITIAIIYIYRKLYGPPELKLFPVVNPEYVVYEPDEWEVQRDKIKLIKELGQGSFGMVYEGNAKDIKGKAQVRCAIKTVNEHATNRERVEFLNEASVMKAFDTAHVVRLLGVVSKEQPTLVVMELMANGDLKSYLRSHRPDLDPYKKPSDKQPPTLKRILQMAIEIADGMAYLAAKKFVHRDLAARNCMVAEDLTVKIGDFGMTRDIYETDYYRKGTKGLLPVRWMAPESLKDGLFSSSSDVWSYGVVLWEMATLASQPYQGLSNDQVLRYVIDGGIMERPDNCPDKLYDLMMRCWRHKPTDRPSFLNLCTLLVEDASPTFCQISFYHSTAGMEARNSRLSYSPSEDDPTTPLRANEEHMSITSSDNDSDRELDSESNIKFNKYASMTKDVSSTVNGYVGTRASNGTTT